VRITNRYDMPEAIVRAVDTGYRPKTDPHRYSVTELIDAPRMVQLKRRHWDEITQDASEMLWLMLGTAVHEMLEQAAPDNTLVEEYFRTEFGDFILTGKADLYELVDGRGILSDYKTTSVWGRIYGNLPRIEQVRQLNCYAELYRMAGFPVDQLQIVAIYRDWQQSQVERRDNYPQAALEVHQVPVWPSEQTRAYLETRLSLHLKAAEMPDALLPLCSEEERWAKPTTYAVKAPERERAVKVCDTFEEARRYILDHDKLNEWYHEMRLGESVRCARYCPAAPFCNQRAEEAT